MARILAPPSDGDQSSNPETLDRSLAGFYSLRMHYIRFFLNRITGRETVLNTRILGISLRLGIAARREIRRAHAISHEKALVERMWAHLQEGDVIYDVGANIGVLTLLMALHPAGTSARVHCFEPEPKNFGQLSHNIALNGLTERLTPHQMALGAEEGEVDLFVRGTAGEGRHSIATASGSTGAIKVQLSTMASFARTAGEAPNMLKIDVEGAEGQVLAGMADLVDSQRPREIFMEIHPKGDRDLMPDGTTIGDWLGERGYSLAWEGERRSGQHRHYHLDPQD